MIDTKYNFVVSNDLKYEYQEGTIQEIKLNCAEGAHLMVIIISAQMFTINNRLYQLM